MASKEEYAQRLSAADDTWGLVLGMIRGADIKTLGDDAAFRDEVRAILDAHEGIWLERLGLARKAST